MPHKSFSVFLAHCATDFVVLLHIIKQGASNQSCGVKREKNCAKCPSLTSISWQRKTERQDLRCPARVCHRHPDAQVWRRCCVHHCGILPGAVAVLRHHLRQLCSVWSDERCYADWKENRPRHKVDKRIYVLLTFFLGWCGAHRFLEHRRKLGIFYLLVG